MLIIDSHLLIHRYRQGFFLNNHKISSGNDAFTIIKKFILISNILQTGFNIFIIFYLFRTTLYLFQPRIENFRDIYYRKTNIKYEVQSFLSKHNNKKEASSKGKYCYQCVKGQVMEKRDLFQPLRVIIKGFSHKCNCSLC